MAENIHPIFDELVSRSRREERLGQRSKVVWLLGLSGSGKSAIAKQLEKLLFAEGYFPQVLDGDNMRTGVSNDLGFSIEDREEQLRRMAEVAKLYLHSGVVVLVSSISPTRASREKARQIVGSGDFIEVFVNAPLEVCEQRDVKGLYAKARLGEIKNFTGIDAPFEAPKAPDLELKTDRMTLEVSVQTLYDYLKPKISL